MDGLSGDVESRWCWFTYREEILNRSGLSHAHKARCYEDFIEELEELSVPNPVRRHRNQMILDMCRTSAEYHRGEMEEQGVGK